ncbi:MAG: hypothetical protein ACI4S2_01500 [Lachnospiraceae bacterium]
MEWLKVLIAGGLIAGVISMINFLLPNYGLKGKKKIEINTEQAKDKINAIKKVIEFEQKANIIEDVNIVHPKLFGIRRITPGENQLIYMSIVEDRNNLIDFWNELAEIRRSEDIWLSRKVSAYLLYAEKYIMDFLEFLKYIEYIENDLYPFGLLIAPDIQRWQRKLDAILVQELNDVPFEMESHSGDEWEYEKEILEESYKQTVLYSLIHKTDEEATKLMCCILYNYTVDIANESDSMEVVAQRLIEEGYITVDQNI